MAGKSSHDPQDVGYKWPTVLAIGVHAAIVLFSLVSLPSRTAEPDSSSIVQATLVSTETFTDQAQQATDQQAAMSAPADAPTEPDAPDEPSASEQQAAAEQQA
ncbi:MAG: cell envelope integrity protein TolA, partial [Halomonas sp.]